MTNTKRTFIPILATGFLIILLVLLPTGFEKNLVFQESDIQSAKVLEVDNSTVIDTGLIRTGDQVCLVKILHGRFKGRQANARNSLIGSLEQDKIFQMGDTALVRINYDGDEILSVSMIDHYRIPYEILLGIVFVVLLLIVAGEIGFRAILSFFLCVLAIWKALIPLYLKGAPPIITGLLITLALTFFIIALVYGFDKRTVIATSGAFLGVLSSCILSILFTKLFHIHGAVMPNSESLLYAGYSHLSLTQIFEASVFIAASGAVTDLAVDVTSAVHEVVLHNPKISWKEATFSGIRVGQAAMGTMTTTLLLAYSGSYVALLMVFMAQGTPIQNILNYKYVAAEFIHTIIGSMNLVLTAPWTALCAGVMAYSSE